MSTPHPTARPYPITAWSAANALGRTVAEVVASLAEGRSGLGPPPLELPFPTVFGLVPGPLPELPPELAAHEARQSRLALLSVEELREPVSRAVARWGAGRVALVMGTSTAGIDRTELAYEARARTGAMPADYDFQRQHSFHAAAEVIGHRLGISGPSFVISTACSSSAKAFGSARRLIDADLADAVVVGGVDSMCRMTLHGFHSLGLVNPERCTPFAVDRQGLNIGEGGAFLLLEREATDAAVQLLGVGESSDAYHMTAPHPEGRGAREAMSGALAQAGLTPADVDHVNAHGTGTSLNDSAEGRAIEDLLGRDVPVVSTKAYTGHLLGACGSTEALFAAIALAEGWIPASLGCEPRDPEIHIHVNAQRRALDCRVVLSNSFAFGGNNASVVLGRIR